MRVGRLLTLPALLGVLAVAASAQIPGMVPQPGAPLPQGNGIIVGEVVDGDSGGPVPGALVMVSAAPAGMANAGRGAGAVALDSLMSLDIGSAFASTQQAIADGQGRFAFTSLAAGTFTLAATKPGWSGGGYGQQRVDGTSVPLLLGADARIGSASLRLWKNAAIGGTVVDEAGEPIVGLVVRALRRTWLAGHARYAPGGSAQTDDRGIYRISALKPGDYVVVIAQTPVTTHVAGPAPAPDPGMLQSLIAAGPGSDPNTMFANMAALMAPGPSAAGLRRGDWMLQTSTFGSRLVPPVTTSGGRMLAYRTIFYPAAITSRDAEALPLRSGEERTGIDFQMRPVPVAQISGTLIAAEPLPDDLPVRLIAAVPDDPASDSSLDGATTAARANGEFMFLGVPSGQYVLRVVHTPRPDFTGMRSGFGAAAPAMIQNAQGNRAMSMGPLTMDMMMPAPPPIPAEPTLWADAPITVGDADISGVTVTLRSGFRVRGRAEFKGSAERPAADRLRQIPILLERANTGGVPPSPFAGMGMQPGGQFDERGDFSTYGVPPGRYLIRVPFSFSGWTLQSAELGGRDVADVPVEIENVDVSGVVLTFTDRPSELSGTVRDAQDAGPAAATIVLFPPQEEGWIDFGSNPRRLRAAKVGPDGRYMFASLPAGDYLVAAVRGEIPSDWQHQAYLRTLAPIATKFTMADGEKKTLDLAVTR